VRYHVASKSQEWKHEKNLMGLRTRKVKYICNNNGEAEQMYDLEVDPHETTNIVDQHSEEAAVFRSDLFSTLSPDPSDESAAQEMDPMAMKRLQALGYMLEDN
jgi:arylsulfatase A-like enzyme